MNNLEKAHDNGSAMQGPVCYKNNKGYKHYLSKLPDHIYAHLKNRCYIERISWYDKHKKKRGLIAMVMNENHCEKHGITPTLTDGYDGFEF